MAADRDNWTRAGLAVVGGSAAVMSFTALADLAHILGVTARMDWPWADQGAGLRGIPVAWLLPLTVDVLAAVATRVWLQRRTNSDALRYARRAAWAAIVATVVGNGAHGYLISATTGHAWGASVIVSAVPAFALGGMVHLAHLVGRGPDPDAPPAPGPTMWDQLLDDVLAEPWDAAILAWAEQVDDDGIRVPTGDEPDEVLVADLRAVNSARDRPMVQDDIRERYRVGQRRAARIRKLAEASTAEDPTPPATVQVPEGVAA